MAFERGECFPDIACVGAPIRGPEGSLAAISLVGDLTAPLETLAPLMANAARRISLTLHSGAAPVRQNGPRVLGQTPRGGLPDQAAATASPRLRQAFPAVSR